MPSNLEIALEALKAVKQFSSSADPAVDQLAAVLYNPDPDIDKNVKRVEHQLALAVNAKRAEVVKIRQEAGYLMESLAVLSFQSLAGWSDLKSYQSAGPQHDLVIEGSSIEWQLLLHYLGLASPAQQAVVVEVKAVKARLADHEFARLCAIMDYNLPHAGLGVFLTWAGASGFPQRLGRASRVLRDCRMRQVIYFARTSKPVIVFDECDIRQLSTSGSLPLLIRRKVREISELTGLPTAPVNEFKQVVLPDYLGKLLKLP